MMQGTAIHGRNQAEFVICQKGMQHIKVKCPCQIVGVRLEDNCKGGETLWPYLSYFSFLIISIWQNLGSPYPLKEWNIFQIFSCHLIKYLFLEVINILISTGLFKQYEIQLF